MTFSFFTGFFLLGIVSLKILSAFKCMALYSNFNCINFDALTFQIFF